jgi:hypothetical protein
VNRTLTVGRTLAVLGAVVLAAAGAGAVIVLRPKPLPPLPSAPHLVTATHPTQVASGPLPRLGTEAGQSYVRPVVIALSGDGGDVITGIRWSSWTLTKAVGTGTRYLQSCNPDCAQGTTTEVPETLVLSDPEGGSFTMIVASYAGEISEYTSGAGLWPLDASMSSNG